MSKEQLTPEQITTLGKKQIGYNRQLAIVGKKAADNVLYFWIEGYKVAVTQQKEKHQQANEFIKDIAKELFGADFLGFDGISWTIDDFKEALNLKLSEQKEQQIAVGEFTISKHPPIPGTNQVNVIWIEHKNGEGMTVDIDKYWKDNF